MKKGALFLPSRELDELGRDAMDALDPVRWEWSDATLDELGLRSCLLFSVEPFTDRDVLCLPAISKMNFTVAILHD